MTTKASVIVSFYNNIRALQLILTALEQQDFSDFEVIIADDGSKPEIVEQINAWKNNFSYPLKHIWQEDKGFRKNRILNKAIIAAEADYIIFVDGDCIPHRSFVKDHLFFSRPERIVAGRRVMMSNFLSQKIEPNFIQRKKLFSFGFFLKILADSLRKKTRHAESGLYLPIPRINRWFGSTTRGVKGCNFSLFKKGLLAVNGFDMRYELPCVGEDTDIEYRLKLLGYEVFLPKFRIIQYHLYHEPLSRNLIKTNQLIFEDTIKSQRSRTKLGMNEISNEDL